MSNINNIPSKSWLVELILVGIVVLTQSFYGQRPYDDAFITYRYARNIGLGEGFVYNPGQQVLGITTPLFAIILAGFGKIAGFEHLPQIAFLINIILEGLIVVLVFRLSRWMLKDWRIAVLITLAYIFHPLRLDVTSGGMETPLFICVLLLMYYSYLVRGRRLSTGFWAGLALLIRPEGLIASLPVFADCFFRDRKTFYKLVGVFSLTILPWVIFSTFYFGHPVPNTILAKSISYRNPAGHALLFLLTFLGTGSLNVYLPVYWILTGFLLVLTLIILGASKLLKSSPNLLIFLLYPLLYTLIMSVQNPAMWFPWYYTPLIPAVIIMLTAALWFPLSKHAVWRWISITLMIFLIPGIPWLINRFNPTWDWDRQREAIYLETCQRIKDEVNPGDLVLAPDIGIVGWCLDQASILDPIGLVSPQALSYQKKLSPNQWISPDLIRDYSPQFILSFGNYLEYISLSSTILDTSYRLVWKKSVVIQDESREMFIYRKDYSVSE